MYLLRFLSPRFNVTIKILGPITIRRRSRTNLLKQKKNVSKYLLNNINLEN